MLGLGGLLALAVLLCGLPLQAQARWISFGGLDDAQAPDVQVLTSNVEKTVIAVEVPGVSVEDVVVGSARYQRLTLPECGTTVEVGSPELPMIRATIAIPFGAEPTLRVVERSSETHPGYRIYPFQQPTTDASDSRSFSIDHHVYGQNALYPATRAWLGDEGIWRDLNVVVIEVAPFRFNPATGDLEVTTSITVEILHNAGRDASFLQEGEAGISPRFERLYRGQVLNLDAIGVTGEVARPSVDDPGTQYLIITHPDFETAIQPLADWHQRRGLRTEVLVMNTTSYTQVKNEITNRYNNGELDYVLLVGDVNYIPVYYWSGHLSDIWYACITGSPDLYADLGLGRLSVTSASQVEDQVDKILLYAKSPPLGDWLMKVVLVAHKEGAPGKYVGCKEYIRNYIISGHGLTIDTIYGHLSSGTNAAVTAAINDGRNIVNYRGHGMTGYWQAWSYYNENWTTGNVYSLSNGEQTPIVFNIACNNHQIQYACLGEVWMSKYPGAAVASLGASDPSYTTPNHDFDKQLFDAIYNEAIWDIGYVLNDASYETMMLHGYYGQENTKMYFWLGDPATEVWTAIPSQLDGEHPGTVPLGPSSFTVTVTSGGSPVQGALVCASKGTEVHETGLTNFSGQVTLSIDVATPGELLVTATKHDYLAYEGEALVGDSPITITLVPDQTSVPRGGTLSLTAHVENTTNVQQTFDGWTMVELPNGNPFGPVAGPQTVTLGPYGSAQKALSHAVPMNAPLGMYTYFGYVGTYPGTVWDEDSFDFQVTTE